MRDSLFFFSLGSTGDFEGSLGGFLGIILILLVSTGISENCLGGLKGIG